VSVHRRQRGATPARWEVRWRQDGRQRSRMFGDRDAAEAFDSRLKSQAERAREMALEGDVRSFAKAVKR
jgi:hypothetical protein